MSKPRTTYRSAVYAMVSQIPAGKVASYGQIAALIPGCTARMVGYALAATPAGMHIPWQRVINANGRISLHGGGIGSQHQKKLLLQEGVIFDDNDRIDWQKFGWLSD